MKPEEQIAEWVKGNPIHNQETDECCPDFSCCTGKIAPKAVRERFAKAYYEKDEETQNEMLMMFLGNALSDLEVNVYIAGSKGNYTHTQ